MRIKKLTCASWIGLASVFTLVAQAANTTVPNKWNVAAWTNGPTLETFETVPDWAAGSGNSFDVTGMGPRNVNVQRFWSTDYPPNRKLVFSTTVTNTFSGAIIQPGVPIFIDMRCKLNPFDATQTPTIDDNTKLCFYSDATSNLVVASKNPTQSYTTTNKVDTGLYHSIMIRFAADKFDVFFNSNTDIAATLIATTNQISKMVISGDGEMDDLYVSYGDPRRTWTNSVVNVSGIGDSVEEQVIKNWMANQAATGSYNKENAEKYYLTGITPSSADFAGELGIGSFSYDPSASNVTVVVTLKKDASAGQSGKINGILKLKGVGDYNSAKNGTWPVDFLGTTTILTNDFVNGVAKYTFKLEGTANTNKFFLPVIKSQVNQ